MLDQFLAYPMALWSSPYEHFVCHLFSGTFDSEWDAAAIYGELSVLVAFVTLDLCVLNSYHEFVVS